MRMHRNYTFVSFFMIFLFLITGSIAIHSYIGIDSVNQREPMQESVIKEQAQQAVEAQFLENLGQVHNDQVIFYGEAFGIGIGFTDSSVLYRLSSTTTPRPQDLQLGSIRNEQSQPALIELVFLGANKVIPQGSKILPHTSNFFIGNDPSNWYSGIRSYREVVYTDLYENIDLVYHVSNDGIKYEFIVRPGGNPEDIELRYEGIDDLTIEIDGSLNAKTPIGALLDKDLYIYQETKAGQKEIGGVFVKKQGIDCSFGFGIIDSYNKDSPLIIDPLLFFSTYLGGSYNDRVYDMDIDSSDNVYIVAETLSSDFPTTPTANDTSLNGGYDVIVCKLSSDGSTLLYSTFLGGSVDDRGYSITVDSSNNAYVTGSAGSSDFPTTSGAYNTTSSGYLEIFVCKLSADGSTLLYSTFVGGTDNDYGVSITLDSVNNAYIAGATQSSDFPITLGANDTTYDGDYDVIVFKLNADGSDLLNSTYIGGNGYEYAYSIALDSSNNCYLTGCTVSADFPTTPGAYNTSFGESIDVFVCKLSADYTNIVFSTYIGGSGADYTYSLAIDSSNNTYVTGCTNSANFPTSLNANDTSFNGGTYDAFVFKLSADGSSLLYSTFLGGSNTDIGKDIQVDASDNAYIVGETLSADFPTTNNAYDISSNGDYDAFISKLNPVGTTILYSTFFGGTLDDHGYAISLDSNDNVVASGATHSNDLPTTSGANDTTYAGWNDAFIFKLDIQNVRIIIESPIDPNYGFEDVRVNYTIFNTTDYSLSIYLDGSANTSAFPSGSYLTDIQHGFRNLTILATNIYGTEYKETVIFFYDATKPNLGSPMDLIYVEDTVGNFIFWTIEDFMPGQYKVEGNGSSTGLTSWSENGTIQFNIDGLTVGFVYNHTITVYDGFGYYTSDTVFVKVIERTDLSLPSDTTIELGSLDNHLTWTLGDVWWPLPFYRIDGNATTVSWTPCVDNTVSLSIDGLDIGVYNITISLRDEYGYQTSDTVFVTVLDTTSPEIDSPSGLTYEVGAVGNNITWYPTDLRPDSYEILRNGTLIGSGTWDGTSISINVDGLEAGLYLYTLIVNDSSGNIATDNVTVFVTPIYNTSTTTTITTTTGTTTTDIMTTGLTYPDDYTIIILGSVGLGFGLGAILVLIVFRRRPS